MRKVHNFPSQGLLMNHTVILHEVGEIRIITAQCYKTSVHTAHCRCPIGSDCHQFMNGDVLFMDIAFKHVVNILTSHSLLYMEKSEEVLLCCKVLESPSDKYNKLSCVHYIQRLKLQ